MSNEELAGETVTDEANDGQYLDQSQEEDAFAVFGGEELKVEARRPDAHKGSIIAVTQYEAPNTGSKAVQVHLQSNDTGGQDEYTIWVPKPFAENTGAFLRRELGIEDLSAGTPDPDRPGKLKGNERGQYGAAIKNSAGDASIQVLLSIASKSGRRPTAGLKIETFEEYVEELNKLLEGVEVVYTRRPQVTEENPRGFLHVTRVLFPEDVESNPKLIPAGKYLRHWEVS
jgi:hypothetical protein